jgi:hypothetical protein
VCVCVCEPITGIRANGLFLLLLKLMDLLSMSCSACVCVCVLLPADTPEIRHVEK